ncbi:MAG: hypothetical protein Q7R42_06955 [Candidatus Planktophila sp.]|nr:hypothetical protein [Candidatus Planktophila sp.]
MGNSVEENSSFHGAITSELPSAIENLCATCASRGTHVLDQSFDLVE